MPWRKKTLTPYRSVDSLSLDGSAEHSSDAVASSAVDTHDLFGGPDVNFDSDARQPFFDRSVDSGTHGMTGFDSSSTEAPLSKVQFDRFLGHAFLSVAQADNVRMPWEKGIFRQIFGDEPLQPSFDMSWIPCAQVPEDVPEATVLELASAASRPPAAESPVYVHAIACISDHDHDSQQSKLKQSACNKWLSILVLCLTSSDVGRHIDALGPLDEHRREAFDILEAVIGVRSYHTAVCRANSILKFLRETLESFPDTTMPFTEDLVWQHFQRLRSSGGATSAASVLSAFRYAKFVMGFECIEAILNSKRLRGLSDILFSGKRKLLQAKTLTVQQVKMLHSVLESAGADKFDRAVAGFLLTALYGRCRVSDLIFLDSIRHDHGDDDGFLELFTAVHKTGRSAAKKATLLPILCPAIGVTGSNWIIHASKAFEQIELKFDGVIQGPLLRPPSHEGPYLCGRSVNATEVGRLLRGLIGLEIAVADSGSQHVSAHSLKATGLAWSARFGLSWPDRAILGRHQSHTNETVAIYSRDLAVGPVTKFAEMIKSIYLGVFCPDAERSQYFPFPPEPPAVPSNKEAQDAQLVEPDAAEVVQDFCKQEPGMVLAGPQQVVDLISESDSTESESGESCIASEESSDGQPLTKRTKFRAADRPNRDSMWFAHRKSGILHLCWNEPSGGDADRKMSACGRTITSNYVAMDETTDGNPLCVICQKRQD